MFSGFSDKRTRLDAGYGSRYGVANDVGSQLMGILAWLLLAAFYHLRTFVSQGSAATSDWKCYRVILNI